jgi:hypothetical protein
MPIRMPDIRTMGIRGIGNSNHRRRFRAPMVLLSVTVTGGRNGETWEGRALCAPSQLDKKCVTQTFI